MGAHSCKEGRRNKKSHFSRPDVEGSVEVNHKEPRTRPIKASDGGKRWESLVNDGPQFTGLVNLGNTCFLNCILQVLFHCPSQSSDLKEIAELSRKNSKIILNNVPLHNQETAAHQLAFVQSLSDVLQTMANPQILECPPRKNETCSHGATSPGGQRTLSSFIKNEQNAQQAVHKTSKMLNRMCNVDTLHDEELARLHQADELFKDLNNLSDSLYESESEGSDSSQYDSCSCTSTSESIVVLCELLDALSKLDPMYEEMAQQDPQEVLQFVLHQVKEVCHLLEAAGVILAAEKEQLQLLRREGQENDGCDTLEEAPAKKHPKSRFKKWRSNVARGFRKLCCSSSRSAAQECESKKEEAKEGTDDSEPHIKENKNIEGATYEQTSRQNGHNIFLGQSKTTTCCLRCGNVTSQDEDLFDIGLSFHPDMRNKNDSEPVPLQYLLNFWARQEHLDGENMLVCSSCKLKVMASCSSSISTLPSMLALHLKRFTMDRNGKASKLLVPTSIPEHLSVRRWCSPECIADDGDPQYTLYAVIEHEGHDLNGGHYTTYINAEAAHREECHGPDSRVKWVHFSDEHVTVMKHDDMQKILSPSGVHIETPYMVFYKRNA